MYVSINTVCTYLSTLFVRIYQRYICIYPGGDEAVDVVGVRVVRHGVFPLKLYTPFDIRIYQRFPYEVDHAYQRSFLNG